MAGLDAAEDILERLPADHQTAARLAAAMIRLAVARRSGNLTAAAQAATRAEALAGQACDGRARPIPGNPGPRAVRSRGRGAVVGPPR